MVQITGKLFTGKTPAVGMVLFQSDSRVAHIDEHVTVLPSPFVAHLVDGAIPPMFEIPANDDGNPSLGTYKVTERIVGRSANIYHIQVRASDGPVQDLSDLAPITASSGFAVVRGPKGDKGDPGLDTGGVFDVAIETAITTHVDSPKPHPIYDDTPDLTLLFQNGLI
jgi:hypothetical protein